MIKILSGKLFNRIRGFEGYADRKFTMEEVTVSMHRFMKARNDVDYFPKNKDYVKKVSLSDFFYNPMAVYEKSQFIKYLVREPPLLLSIVDPDPEVSNLIMGIYNEASGESKNSTDFFVATTQMLLIIEENSIRNPDLIYAGAKIFIPEQE